MKRLDKAAEIASQLIGNPYIFGAYGQICTPKYREQVMQSKPSYAEKIEKNCPVLSGKQKTCSGCKYNNKQSFDCRGLTWYVCNQVGISISRVGATTQWKTDSWQEKGLIKDLPDGCAAILFREENDLMQHTGIRNADGLVIDSRGHASGVVANDASKYPWTHYAIPRGADDLIAQDPSEGDELMYKKVKLQSSKTLNMRNAPGTDSAVIGGVPNGEIVEVITSGDWPYVRYAGKSGYVSGQYLIDTDYTPVAVKRIVVKDSKGNIFRPDGEMTIYMEDA